MGPWVMCRRWNLQESMWQNSKKNHLMIDPKMGYTSVNPSITLSLDRFVGTAYQRLLIKSSIALLTTIGCSAKII
jgi:hypothetical protein